MNSVKNNYMYSLIYQILISLIPLITTPYLARILGAENVGIYSYSNSIVQYFVLIARLGILDYGSRTIAMAKDKIERGKIFFEIYFIQILMGIISLVLYLIYLNICVSEYYLIFQIQSISILTALADINWFFFGIEKFKITVTRNIIIKFVSLISVFVFVKTKDDLIRYVLIMVLSSFLSNAVLWIFLRKEIEISSLKIRNSFQHFTPCLILMLPLLSRSIFVYLDKTMLGLMASMMETGFYEYSEKIIVMITSIVTPLGTVMLPRITNLLARHEEKKAQQYTALSLDFVVAAGSALTVGMFVLAEPIIMVFLGESYIGCIKIVKVMSLTILLVGWTNVIRTQYILPYHKDKIYALAVFLGALVDFIVNILLIPRYGAYGAAIGWVAAEIVITVTQTYFAGKNLPVFSYLKKNIGFVINSLLMGIVVKFIEKFWKMSIISLMGCFLSGVGIYIFLTILFLKYFRKDLWERVIKQINNRI